MNFQQLEYVIAVDKYRNFAKAAESCFVTQATLSAMIKKLETELNTIIFDRKKQPTITTLEGQQVIEIARKILSFQKDLKNLKTEKSTDIKGDLRIGVIPTIANSLLPIIIKPILTDYPELNITLIEITTEEIKRQLKTDHIDLGILATPLEDEKIAEEILYYEAMMVYGVNDPSKKYILPTDIENENIWLLEEGHCFRKQSVTICDIKEKSLAPTNFNFEARSFDTLLNLTDQFGGYTLVPELYYNLMAPARKIKTRHFELPMPVREISMVYHRPYAKKKIIDLFSVKIKKLLKSKLSTYQHPSKDLSVIGIN